LEDHINLKKLLKLKQKKKSNKHDCIKLGEKEIKALLNCGFMTGCELVKIVTGKISDDKNKIESLYSELSGWNKPDVVNGWVAMTLCVLVSNTRKHSMITQENIQ
jgi:hypothetical protein